MEYFNWKKLFLYCYRKKREADPNYKLAPSVVKTPKDPSQEEVPVFLYFLFLISPEWSSSVIGYFKLWRDQ
jgi:hypothetical protein